MDELISETLGHGLGVTEGGLTGALGEEVQSLGNTTVRRHIDGLTTDGTGGTDAGGIFARARVGDGINQNLDGVQTSEQMNDLKSLLDNADSLELLSVVATVHHQRADKTLNDGALGLAETLGGITSGCVGKILDELVLLLDGNVISKGDIREINLIGVPKKKMKLKMKI